MNQNNFRNFADKYIKPVAAIVMSLFILLTVSVAQITAFAEPTPSPKASAHKSSPSPKPTAADKKSDNSNDEKRPKESKSPDEDEAEATPEPSKDPRVGDDGKPIIPENECAVLIDARSGEVMFEHNADKRIYPASTTKIMTALLVIEAAERGEVNLNSAFLITEDMLENLAADGSSMGLKIGEAMTVQNLLEGLLVQSGNDAAQALAVIICGDTETFVQRMNDKAGELKLSDTHFMNPHGLHNDEHYTTALDLCSIAREAMKHKTFRDIVAKAQVVIPATEKTGVRTYTNTNGLLSTLRFTDYYYQNATGIKTGHTSEAGYCLVSSAQKGDLQVIAAVMNAANEDDKHFDSRNMLRYAVDNFKAVTPVKSGDMLSEVRVRFGRGADHTTLSAVDDVTVTIPVDADEKNIEVRPVVPDYVAAPVEADEKIGYAELVLDGKVIGKAELLTDAKVKRHPLGFLMQFFAFIWSFTAVKVITIVLLAAIIIFVIYMAVNIRRNIKRAQRQRRKSARRR